MADKQVVPFRNAALRRDNYELAFLPAALEIAETPPSPIGRAIGATIIGIFCLTLAWAAVGKVDIVATAPGKIVSTGRSKLIQPFETGVVRAIHIHDGMSVKAGDVLIELDPTMSEAEQQHMQSDLTAIDLEVARLRAALNGQADFLPPQGASPAALDMHRQLLLSQQSEQNAKLAELDREQSQKEAERKTLLANIGKLQATLPILQERVDTRRFLSDKGLGSKLTYLTEYQDLIALQQDLVVQQSKTHESDAAIAALKETKEKAVAEYRRGLFDALAKAEQKSAGVSQDVVKAEQRTKMQILKSPVDGVVQQLSIHTVGGVVTPAQTLAVIVPAESRLEIEASLSNQDIGFIQAGDDVEIKVDTFNFTQYGLLHGKVLSVSQDAIVRDAQKENAGEKSSKEANAPESRSQDLFYTARVSLDRTQMQIDNRLAKLGPGMAVTAEIRTGSRKILSYLLSPLIKYKQEALRER